MNRDEAYTLLTKYMSNKNLIKHSLAAEVTMKALYRHLTLKDDQNNLDEVKWGITGLLHDMDYEIAQKENRVEQHGMMIGIAEKESMPQDIVHGIQAHAHVYTKIMPESQMDWAITACDQLTGLIVAGALVTPDKKIGLLTTESVLKRFKEKSFAKGADRNAILLCEEKLGIPLPEFVAITLTAMQTIADPLGL